MKSSIKKYTIKEMKEFARKMEGDCLSSYYKSNGSKLTWQCKDGHVWEARPRDIHRGHWCPKCAGNERLTIEYIKSVALTKGGECLSNEYINNRTKLRWKCNNGHEWEARPNNILNGSWCPQCFGKIKYTLEDMWSIAGTKGGECLSSEYISIERKLKWRCSFGHEWEASPQHVINSNSWCPQCVNNRYISQEKCRYIFESIFQKEFKINRTLLGNKLELDGYNAELDLAYEYNGIQHYKYRDKFHKELNDFIRQKEKDENKKALCEEKNIKLIQIPYWVAEKNDKELIEFILIAIKDFKLNDSIIKSTIDMSKFYKSYTPLNQLINIARERGGECLSTEYINNSSKLLWRCSKAHEWKATANDVKGGHWCPTCGGTAKLSLRDMKALATAKGGECLSTEYTNGKTKLKWRCEKGHEWEATPCGVRAGYWCPICGGTAKLSLKDMIVLAASRGGECLSAEYVNSKSKLKWKCAEGHEWEATPYNVKKGSWCPKCAMKNASNNRKYTIDDIRAIAEVRNGECLSFEYVSTDVKVRWRCSEKHEWNATPANVKRGSWCPKCARINGSARIK